MLLLITGILSDILIEKLNYQTNYIYNLCLYICFLLIIINLIQICYKRINIKFIKNESNLYSLQELNTTEFETNDISNLNIQYETNNNSQKWCECNF